MRSLKNQEKCMYFKLQHTDDDHRFEEVPEPSWVHSMPRRTAHATSVASMDTGRENALGRRMQTLRKGKEMGLDLQLHS
jgi:hypothetical protein